jgi:hypothetical protein
MRDDGKGLNRPTVQGIPSFADVLQYSSISVLYQRSRSVL